MKKALSIFVTLVFALTMVTAAVSANADGLDDVIDASALSSIQDVINSSTDVPFPEPRLIASKPRLECSRAATCPSARSTT